MFSLHFIHSEPGPSLYPLLRWCNTVTDQNRCPRTEQFIAFGKEHLDPVCNYNEGTQINTEDSGVTEAGYETEII